MSRKTCGKLIVTLIGALGLLGCMSSPPGSPSDSPKAEMYADPDQLQTLISKKGEPYYLVDVRTVDEYERGHIPTAVNIPFDTIADNPPTPYKATLIVVYCASGARSAKAKQSLAALGYLRVVDFGSISRWKGSSISGTDPGECPCRTL